MGTVLSHFKAGHKALASSRQLSKHTRDHPAARESDSRLHFQPAQIQKVLTTLLDFLGSPQVGVHTGRSTSMHRSFSTMLFSGVSLLALSDSCLTDDTNCLTQILKSDI